MKGYAIFSDCHGNTPALRAAIEDAERRGFNSCIFLGDAVNGADPAGCVRLLREREISCIRGNAEENACTENVGDFPWRDTAKWAWIVPSVTWWQEAVGEELFSWIRSWPRELQIDDTWLLHDSPYSRQVFPERPNGLPAEYATLTFHGDAMPVETSHPAFETNVRLIRAVGHRTLFCGHSHRPSLIEHEELTICNVGSVGMNLDGDYRPSWVAWSGDEIEIHRIDYDVDEILRIIKNSDMPGVDERYVRMFTHGVHWSRQDSPN